MSVTLLSLKNDTLNHLNEALNSPAGALQSGTGGTPTQATPVTITAYLNEAAAQIARSCWALLSTGSLTTAIPGSTGEFIIPFNTLAAGSYGNLWAARHVYYGGVPLIRISRKFAETLYPTYAVDAPGVPLYWFPAGISGIGLVPKPNGAVAVVVDGLALPATLVNDTDTSSWLDDDLTRYLTYYAAAMIAKKNMEDESLTSRAEVWLSEYESGRMQMFERLLRMDSSTAAAFFPEFLAKYRGSGQSK